VVQKCWRTNMLSTWRLSRALLATSSLAIFKKHQLVMVRTMIKFISLIRFKNYVRFFSCVWNLINPFSKTTLQKLSKARADFMNIETEAQKCLKRVSCSKRQNLDWTTDNCKQWQNLYIKYWPMPLLNCNLKIIQKTG